MDFSKFLSDAGLSVAEYARLTGGHPQNLYKRARGATSVPAEVAALLAALLEAERPRAPRSAGELLRLAALREREAS